MADRPPAPKCQAPECTELTEWSKGSLRWLKYCSAECRTSRGTCRSGLHPRPAGGEKCKLCKRARDNEYTARRRELEGRTTIGPAKPKPVAASVLPVAPSLAATRPVWRPAGIDRWAARGGPDCPVAIRGEA